MPTILATPRGEVHIRPAIASDAGAYRELRLEALKKHPTAFGANYEENLQYPLEHWQERVNVDDEKEALFLAENQGQLVGMTGIYRRLSEEFRHSGTVWGVYVKEAWRGAHIAEALIRACLEWARGRQMLIAKLGVAADNRPAIRSYERCGFTTYGIEPKARFFQGRYIDACFMSCPLEEPSFGR